MEIRVCWHCGAENGPGRGTCGHCNDRLDDDPNQSTREDTMPAHKTTVTHKPRPKSGGYQVSGPCSWVSYGHDTRQDAESWGKQHEAERNH